MAQNSLSVLALAFVASAFVSTGVAQDAERTPSKAVFGEPEQLTAEGKSMVGILYPSPTLFDLDGDGRRELLIGDLPGRIRVARHEKAQAWGKLEMLQSKLNKPIKLNNW